MEDEDSITEDEVHAALRSAVMDMSIIPMICGSAFKNKGVQFLLDAVCRYLPSPVDKDAIVGTNPDTDEEELRKPDVNEPFSALAFKIATDPFVGRLAFFRAYSGRLDAGSYVLNNPRLYSSTSFITNQLITQATISTNFSSIKCFIIVICFYYFFSP
jgi:elongation factor G